MAHCLMHRQESAPWKATHASFRDVEDLLAERGIMVSYETVRRYLSTILDDFSRYIIAWK
jgi:transposase-like protein